MASVLMTLLLKTMGGAEAVTTWQIKQGRKQPEAKVASGSGKAFCEK